MLTDTEEKVLGLLKTYAVMDTDGIVRHSDADPLDIPKAIGRLMRAGMVRVQGYHYGPRQYADGRVHRGDKIPHFGVA